MEQSTNIYPKLDQPSNNTTSTPSVQQPTTTTFSPSQQKVETDLKTAKQWETKGEWKMAYDIYTNLAEFGFKNPDAMNKTRLSQIIARAEAIKIRMEPEDLLLNIPDGVRIFKQNNNEAEEVSVAFTLKQVSKFVVFNASNLIQFYVKDCYFLKKDIGGGKFVYSVQNTNVNQMYTIELDSTKMGKEYIDTFDEIVQKQAIEFKISGEEVKAPEILEPTVKPTLKPTTNYPLGPEVKDKTSVTPQMNKTTADKISSGITTTSNYIGEAVDVLSEKTKSVYSNYSQNYVATEKPNEKPTEISDSTLKLLSASKTATRHAANVTGTVAGWIGSAVKFGAGKIGEHIDKHYIPEKDKTKERESKMDKVVKIGGSSISAIGSIWNNLEKNGRDVGRAVREDTVKMVNHKHGEKAAKATDDGFRTAIDGTRTVFYINDMGIKAIAKNTAKQAGKQVVKMQKEKRADNVQMN
jgi:hypothetical protein